METKRAIFFFMTIFFMILMLVSFATKGAHWDQVKNKEYAEYNFSEVYRSLQGLITMDVLLFILCLPILIFMSKDNQNVIKALMILLFLMLLIRFILSVIFLAGNEEYCRKSIEAYDDLPQNLKDYYGEENYYTTLKGAWGFEILCVILVDILGGGIFLMMFRKKNMN